ncbi:hypothetical protein HY768_08130 [candidate division TA06 bacterium]|uniref:Type II toxin-antitoxin system HicA family toxin n=1 Tax=candidate division TA06 bacterium TaxID=2250710 RepID=A0A933IAE3_UNCT6|nr:hypothetical protein [candidate division TA06 bacterium]
MANKREIYEELCRNLNNLRFEKLCRQVEKFGFTFNGGKGSHKINKDDDYYNLDDLKRAQKLSYGQRMEMLEKINEFLMKTMSEKNKRISLKLQENNF